MGQCTDEFLAQASNYTVFGCCERSEKNCGLVCRLPGFFGFGGSPGLRNGLVGVCGGLMLCCVALGMGRNL